ncbi:MAG TPA: 3',5'-cyclic-nucleotide phosphodiesterase [Verrucomicrobiae bacterium]|nr:3',5'-cyclic-nucleotide phosphodiesterase [Verrucomicrobiae bacterium]
MRIKVLGCSGGVGPGLRTTSLLVNDEVLIDAGTGVCDLSLAQMARISDVFLTHSHLDHVAGLAFMVDNLFDIIERPMRVHATAETLATLREHLFNWKLWPDFSKLPDEKNPLMTWHEVSVGTPDKVNGHSLTAFNVLHTVPGVGYALQGKEGTFAFSGDTCACEELWNALNALPRLDKLMIEVAFTNDDDELARVSRHFTPALLGSELQKLRHKPKLYLTHHKPGCEAEIEQETGIALAGHEYHHLRRGDVITL